MGLNLRDAPTAGRRNALKAREGQPADPSAHGPEATGARMICPARHRHANERSALPTLTTMGPLWAASERLPPEMLRIAQWRDMVSVGEHVRC